MSVPPDKPLSPAGLALYAAAYAFVWRRPWVPHPDDPPDVGDLYHTLDHMEGAGWSAFRARHGDLLDAANVPRTLFD